MKKPRLIDYRVCTAKLLALESPGMPGLCAGRQQRGRWGYFSLCSSGKVGAGHGPELPGEKDSIVLILTKLYRLRRATFLHFT